MKIYDFETFEKNCKNVKAVKFKKMKNISEWFLLKNFFIAKFSLNKKAFNDYVEYVETKDSTEIE
jgi:hypothetical protein